MSDKRIGKQHHAVFDDIRRQDEVGNEFWLARPLAKVLDYSEYRHFLPVIDRAREACRNSDQDVGDHFEDILDMVEIGSGARREVADVRLSRYACYLIVQNGDPAKPVIANGQTYFALQTRRQELADDVRFAELGEDEKRLAIRNELATHNKYLAAAAKGAGVVSPLDYAVFSGPWVSRSVRWIDPEADSSKERPEEIAEDSRSHGSTELATNLFRATQTEDKLKRDRIKGKDRANQTHFDVGSKVRQTIDELGGTMPERLSTPEQSIQQIERAKKKLDSK